VKTRTLLVLCALCAGAILAAGVAFVFAIH
jgi:hypothetical protein